MMKIYFFILSLLAFSFVACEDSSSGDTNPGVPETLAPENPAPPADPDIPENPDLDPATDYEWDSHPVSVKIPEGKKWQLHSQSDEFKIDAAPVATETELNGKWTNFYHAHWNGPAPTYWQHDHVWIEGGYMKIKATRPEEAKAIILDVKLGGETKQLPATFTGCATSVERIQYPAYIEARVKLSNSTMASDVWMLSEDDTQEIDIWEAYGGDRNVGDDGRVFLGNDRLHLSHHTFERSDPNNLLDYQPMMEETWYRSPEGTIWRDDFHTVGVFWRDPWNLEYYVDGKLVRVVKKDLIDPLGYTGGTGLNKELDIIINMEDQSWRAFSGMSPTDEELQNQENCTMLIDWIRIYNLVDDQVTE